MKHHYIYKKTTFSLQTFFLHSTALITKVRNKHLDSRVYFEVKPNETKLFCVIE